MYQFTVWPLARAKTSAQFPLAAADPDAPPDEDIAGPALEDSAEASPEVAAEPSGLEADEGDDEVADADSDDDDVVGRSEVDGPAAGGLDEQAARVSTAPRPRTRIRAGRRTAGKKGS